MSNSSSATPRVRLSLIEALKRTRAPFAVVLTALSLAPLAHAKATVKEKILYKGQPALHTLVSLYDSTTNSRIAGPVSTGDDGVATFAAVDDGDVYLKAETPAGYGKQKIHIDTKTPDQSVNLDEIVPQLALSDRLLPLFLCLFTVFLVVYPILRYLFKPWSFRRQRLIGQLSGKSMELYYKQFRTGSMVLDSAGQLRPVGDPALDVDDFSTYNQSFKKDFNKWYGRHYYIAPFAGLVLLSIVCGYWGCQNLWDWSDGLHSIDSMRGLVGSAIAGAFLWIIYDEIDRLRRRDFTTSDVYYYIFRLVICIPFAWAFTGLQFSIAVGIPIAFLLGSLPTATLFTLGRRLVNQQFKLGDDPATGKLELESLQSVGRDIAERFKDEGISTIVQLAYTDPVDLTIRTNFDFNFVVDCVSQSLLWIYLGGTLNIADAGSPAQTVDIMKTIQIYGLRGAQEVYYIYNDLGDQAQLDANTLKAAANCLKANTDCATAQTNRADAKTPADIQAADEMIAKTKHALEEATRDQDTVAKAVAARVVALKSLTDVAAKLNLSFESLATTLNQVAEDPYTVFLVKIWETD